MKKFLVGCYINNVFSDPYSIFEVNSAREAIKAYKSCGGMNGEVMCVINQKTGIPNHIHKDADRNDCISIIEELSIDHDPMDDYAADYYIDKAEIMNYRRFKNHG